MFLLCKKVFFFAANSFDFAVLYLDRWRVGHTLTMGLGGSKFIFPVPSGPYSVGCCDVMTPEPPHEGGYLREFITPLKNKILR